MNLILYSFTLTSSSNILSSKSRKPFAVFFYRLRNRKKIENIDIFIERERERFNGMQLIDTTKIPHFGDGLKEVIRDYLHNLQLWKLNYFLKLLGCNYLLVSHVG